MERLISENLIQEFKQFLFREERSPGTVEKYLRDMHVFCTWLGDQAVTKEAAIGWKEHLQEEHYAPATINSMLAALNAFFCYMNWSDCRVKSLRLQRRLFRDQTLELSRAEYELLVNAAYSLEKERLGLLLETLGSTGMRVSELQYVTVEAVRYGRVDISLKGKIRTILLPTKLCRKLQKYAQRQKIAFGEIFVTKSGRGLSRKQIWAEMKWLCRKAGVDAKKVFPHNLRHLFARAFYKACKDIAKLADVLGHSSIETTRIYLLASGKEHVRQINRLNLII